MTVAKTEDGQGSDTTQTLSCGCLILRRDGKVFYEKRCTHGLHYINGTRLDLPVVGA